MSKDQELIIPGERVDRPRPYNPPVLSDNGSDKIMQIVERMLRESAFDPDRIEKMLALKAQWEAAEAEKSFNRAMAGFKKNPPQVFADKINKQYDSQYASLGNFVNTVNSALGQFDLEASWEI